MCILYDHETASLQQPPLAVISTTIEIFKMASSPISWLLCAFVTAPGSTPCKCDPGKQSSLFSAGMTLKPRGASPSAAPCSSTTVGPPCAVKNSTLLITCGQKALLRGTPANSATFSSAINSLSAVLSHPLCRHLPPKNECISSHKPSKGWPIFDEHV